MPRAGAAAAQPASDVAPERPRYGELRARRAEGEADAAASADAPTTSAAAPADGALTRRRYQLTGFSGV